MKETERCGSRRTRAADHARRSTANRSAMSSGRSPRAAAGEPAVSTGHPGASGLHSVELMLRLQASAGNSAVAQLVATQRQSGTIPSTVQRQPRKDAAAPAERGQGGAAAGEVDVASALSALNLEYLRTTATATTFLAGAYAERGLRTVDVLKTSLVSASNTYTDAYGSYAKVVRAAGKEARNQQDWTNIIVGIAIGTGVGLLAAAVVPEGLALGWAILAEATGEAVEAAAAGAVQGLGLTDVAGADLEPGGLDPHVLSSDIWQRLSGLYRSTLGVQRHTQYLPLLLGNTEYALGQFRLLDAGAPADMSRPDLIDMATTLHRSAAHLQQLNTELRQRLQDLDKLGAQVAAAPRFAARQMEHEVWIMWMAGLSDSQSDILDLDEIEDHLTAIGVLGEGSVLGVDFGRWTSKDDELEALSAARSQAGAIQERYRALTGS